MDPQKIDELIAHVKEGKIIDETDMKTVCFHVRSLLIEEPNMYSIEGKVVVVGDVHGQFYDFLQIFDLCGEPSKTRFLFLGDLVDRGFMGLEIVTYLFLWKLRYPENVLLVRGNHESRNANLTYGFVEECKKKYRSIEAWEKICNVFDSFPVAALINKKILCVHGGISPLLESLDDIRAIDRLREVCIGKQNLMADILWNDPDSSLKSDFGSSARGPFFSTFGEEHAKAFFKKTGVTKLIRAHELCSEGFKESLPNVYTIWSAPNYAGKYQNKAAVMQINSKNEFTLKYFEVSQKAIEGAHAENTSESPGIVRKYFTD